MALALLLHDWLAARQGRLLALVVDHRLRAGSTAEALLVVDRLAGLGIAAELLTRTGPPLASRIQAEARRARYALLSHAAARAGILHLAVAHHAGDQQETVALRRASSSGPRGLAGMAAMRELGHVRLLRPLLGAAPATLRGLLEARSVPWVEDPSNHDPRFWRGRQRTRGIVSAGGGDRAAASRARATLDEEIAAHFALHGRPSRLGFVTLSAGSLAVLPRASRLHLLGRLIAATGGAHWAPRQRQLAGLDAWLERTIAGRRSLGGVLIDRLDDRLRFLREPRAVAGPGKVASGGMLWDGRFRIAPSPDAPAGLEVSAAGLGWRRHLADLGIDAGRMEAPSLVLATLPLIKADGRAVRLGPWPVTSAGLALTVSYRPPLRHTDVPFGHSMSG